MTKRKELKIAADEALEMYDQLSMAIADYFHLRTIRRRSIREVAVDLATVLMMVLFFGTTVAYIMVSGIDVVSDVWCVVMIAIFFPMMAAMIVRLAIKEVLNLELSREGTILPLSYRGVLRAVQKELQRIPVMVSEMEKDVFRSKPWVERLEKTTQEIAAKRKMQGETEIHYNDIEGVYLMLKLSVDGFVFDHKVTATDDGYREAVDWLRNANFCCGEE